jgi:Arc/MetJ-type ribon-helix-helix transcriptional regulator
MSQTTTMTVRLNATLSDFVAANVRDDGAYENVSEYMRDLIRRDMERKEQARSLRPKTRKRIRRDPGPAELGPRGQRRGTALRLSLSRPSCVASWQDQRRLLLLRSPPW